MWGSRQPCGISTPAVPCLWVFAQRHPGSRNPLPIQLESCSMPTDSGFGLNNENRPLPAGPDSAQEGPEELVGQRRAAPRSLPDHERKLLSQRQVFEQEIVTRTTKTRTRSDENAQYSNHWFKNNLKSSPEHHADFKVDRSFCEAQGYSPGLFCEINYYPYFFGRGIPSILVSERAIKEKLLGVINSREDQSNKSRR
jgi:hypothetical protein